MTIPLSIVIPSHCRADLLRLCLAGVTRHAPPATEIIVVDDGSPHAQACRTASEFSGVQVIRLPRRSNFCRAVNAGICASRGEIVELLNDDTQVEPGWAAAALRCFDDPRVAAVAPLVLCGQPGDSRRIIDSAGDGYDPGGFAFKRGRGRPFSVEYAAACDVAAASGSSVFLRRAALEQVGLLPEDFGAYFEDVDLCLRLTAAGWRIRYEPSSVVWHHGGASYGRRDRRLVERQSCNEERLFWRNRTGGWRTLLRHAAILGGKAIRRLREGRFVPFAMGRLRAVLKREPRTENRA